MTITGEQLATWKRSAETLLDRNANAFVDPDALKQAAIITQLVSEVDRLQKFEKAMLDYEVVAMRAIGIAQAQRDDARRDNVDLNRRVTSLLITLNGIAVLAKNVP